MARPPSRTPAAGGIFVALGALLGPIGGLVARQPSIGFLTGLAIGAAIAVAMWWRNARL